MQVTCDVVGDDEYEVEVTDGTYADLLEAVGLTRHEATVLVDGRPVPEDQPVSAEHVQVLRVVTGG